MCYDFTPITDYLNEDSTRKMLGVGDITWQSCSNRVYTYMEDDFEVNFRDDIPLLLSAGVRVTIYEGVEDLICNFYGASATLETLNWPGQSGFNTAANVTWHVSGSVAGSARAYSNLTYVNVLAAGHMVCFVCALICFSHFNQCRFPTTSPKMRWTSLRASSRINNSIKGSRIFSENALQ